MARSRSSHRWLKEHFDDEFVRRAQAEGWEVNVVDTKGDVAAVVSRLEDAANQKVDAIVINVDPAQVSAGLDAAKAAGVTHKILVRTGKAVTEEGQALADDVQDSLLTFAKSVPALV